MATIKDLAVLIAEPLGKPLDATFLEQMADRIKYWRSRLLKNTLDKAPADRKFFQQSLTLELEQVDAAACNLPLDCKVWRTKVQVPNPVRANSILFDYVGSVDHGNPFKYVKRWELSYLLTNKYMPLVTTFYAYEDGYLISSVPWITIEGIFDDPEAVMALTCNGADCTTTEQEYPVSGEIAQLIVQSILTVDFNVKPLKEKEETEVEIS